MPLECENKVADIVLKQATLLLSEEKRKRRAALEVIRDKLFEDDLCLVPVDDLDKIYAQIQRNLLKCLTDNSEICREISVLLINRIIYTLPVHERYFAPLIPHILQRVGSEEIVEPSEEVRLSVVVLLRTSVKKNGPLLHPYLNEIVQILCKTLTDPYPMVKKESCECTSNVATLLCKHFHMQSETLVKPLLKVITHQHFKVRVAGVKALGDVILHGNSKSIDDVIGPLAERLFDQTVPVRVAVAQIVGNWLINYPDRYSFFHKFMPLILTCLMDDISEVKGNAADNWKKAGEQYEAENENELKDLKDFINSPPTHYPLTERPNLGCRTLVKNNLSKIIPALVRELGDWTPEVRLKSACLLYQLLLHAESSMTLHLDRVLSGMYGASCDEEGNIVMQVEKAAELIGFFVPPKTYCGLILPVLENSPTSGHLFVFAAIIRGSENDTLSEELCAIGQLLSKTTICHNMKSDFQRQLLRCCEAIMTTCTDSCCSISSHLFRILVTMCGLSSEEDISQISEALLCRLRDLEKLPSNVELYEKFMAPLLEEFFNSAGSWSVYSPERFILEELLKKSGSAVGHHWEYVSRVLMLALNPGSNAEVRVILFTLLSNVLANRNGELNSLTNPSSSLLILIQGVIFPNLEWHAGRTASAVRTAALSCLCCCLNYNPSLTMELTSGKQSHLPTFLSLVEDDSHLTRQLALNLLCQIFERCVEKMAIDGIIKASEVIVKRFDDVNDAVRVTSLETITLLFSKLPVGNDLEYYRPHVLSIYSTALIHLDDSDGKFTELVLEMLKKIGRLLPQELYEKVVKSKSKFRNETGCEELLQHLKKISI